MGPTATTRRAGTAAALLLMGCGEPQLPGHYWELDFSTAVDECNTPAVGSSDQYTYRLEFGVEEITVSIGADTFATGVVNGCTVSYESVTWTTARPAGDIQWTLSGEATAQRGDSSCGIASDWIGQETFTVVSSADPGVRPGCTFTLDVSGTYVGEVE